MIPEDELRSIRAILLGREQAELAQLTAEKAALVAQLAALQQEMVELEQSHAEKLAELRDVLAALQGQVRENEAKLLQQVTADIDQAVRAHNHEAQAKLAEAIGPMVADVIEVQIREDRDELIEVLNPIIIPTIGRFIQQSLRELRDNIEAQLRSLAGRRNLTGDMAIAQALPFHVREIFLIQRRSGLLLAHYRAESEPEEDDSDLISGMLTAIRDFVHDSFGSEGDDGELDAIQYGEQRIVIRGGTAVYLAIVLTGYEPTGTSVILSEYLSELHLKHGSAFRAYQGDAATLPNLEPSLVELVATLAQQVPAAQPARAAKMSRRQKLAWLFIGLGLLFVIGASTFYLWLAIRLYPLTVVHPTPTATATVLPTATATATPSPTATVTPLPTNTATPLPTNTATATLLPTNTATATLLPTATVTAVPELLVRSQTAVWTRQLPESDEVVDQVIPPATELTLLAVFGEWLEVSWRYGRGIEQRGWVPTRWVEIQGTVPARIVTPTAGN